MHTLAGTSPHAVSRTKRNNYKKSTYTAAQKHLSKIMALPPNKRHRLHTRGFNWRRCGEVNMNPSITRFIGKVYSGLDTYSVNPLYINLGRQVVLG